jgi:hypothetical protein
MTSRLFVVSVLIAIASAAPSFAASPACDGPEFSAFRTEFTNAANAGDKARLAKMIGFPVEYWAAATRGDVQTEGVKTEAEFLKRYDQLFTAFMRKGLKTAKLTPLQEGRCALMWHDANSEFFVRIPVCARGGIPDERLRRRRVLILPHPVPPRTRPRHQMVIAFHHLHRRPQAFAGGVHAHVAGDVAVLF